MDSPAPDGKERFLTAPMIAALVVSTLLLALNYLAFPEFGSFGNENSIQWLISSWNKQTDYEHGWLVVPIIVFMLYHARKKIAQAPRRMDWRGLILFIPAIMLLMLSFRVGQPRVAVGALPLILLGGAWYLADRRPPGCAPSRCSFSGCVSPCPPSSRLRWDFKSSRRSWGIGGQASSGWIPICRAPISALPADTGMPSILQEGAAACVP